MTLSCSKKALPTDYSEVQLVTLDVTDIREDSFTLKGQINHLNGIPVTEYGFIIKKKAFPVSLEQEEFIKLNGNVKTGLIQHTYKSDKTLELDQHYAYAIYVKTQSGYYKGDFKSFTIDQIQINTIDSIAATVGQIIHVTGDFKHLRDRHYITTDIHSKEEIPYTLSSDKKTLSFAVPNTNKMVHGRKIHFDLKNTALWGSDTYRRVATVRILAKINPPQQSQLYTSGPIIFRGTGITSPVYQEMYAPLYLLFNGHKIPYKEYIYREDIKLPGNKFKIGYHNGRDSIVFDQAIEWMPLGQ